MIFKYRNDDKLRDWQNSIDQDYYKLHAKNNDLQKETEDLGDRVSDLEAYVSRLEDIVTEMLLKQGLEAVDVPEHIELVKIKK